MTKQKLSKDVEYDADMLLQTVGVQLRTAMRAAGVTLNQLAEKMEWTPERVLQVMEGKLDIELKELINLFWYCGCQVSDYKIGKKSLRAKLVVKMEKR